MTKTDSTEASARPGFGSWLWGWVRSVTVVIVIWFLLSTFVVQAFHIPSPSMEKTLLIGDVLFVNKALYGAEVPLIHKRLPAIREPRAGEIVVVKSPIEDLLLVKRLAALGGDTVAMREGHLYRNGTPVAEPFLTLGNPAPEMGAGVGERMRAWQAPLLAGIDSAAYHPDLRNWGPIVVPAGKMVLLGDNRDESFDSRYYGLVPRENLRGSPLIIYWSYQPDSWRAVPILTTLRWRRLFTIPR
jgi:signal peptidase I